MPVSIGTTENTFANPIGLLSDCHRRQPDGSAYRIHKTIRDMLIFSEHDLIKNPAFSKLDLISCRNLLIYMGAELQKKLMPLFHYALNPGGMLVLGSSESVGDFVNLFAPVERKSRIYQRKAPTAWASRDCSSARRETKSRGGRGAAHSATTNFRCTRLPNGRSWSTTPRLARWSAIAAISFTCWAVPAGIWSQPQARPA
jgi:hypothetical protein